MLHLILLETALELVPPQIASKKPIQRHAHRRKKSWNELVLDQSYHGKAMVNLDDSDRRGRPDILFFCLQAVLETPLCNAGLLTLHVHLQDGRIIEVNPSVRIPRNYERFIGLMEQLLLTGKVPPNGPSLLQIVPETQPELLLKLKTTDDALAILASEHGNLSNPKDLLDVLPNDPQVPVVFGVGAFPHGEFSESIPALFDRHIALDTNVMMAWHVCSEMLWMYALKLNLLSK